MESDHVVEVEPLQVRNSLECRAVITDHYYSVSDTCRLTRHQICSPPYPAFSPHQYSWPRSDQYVAGPAVWTEWGGPDSWRWCRGGLAQRSLRIKVSVTVTCLLCCWWGRTAPFVYSGPGLISHVYQHFYLNSNTISFGISNSKLHNDLIVPNMWKEETLYHLN